MMFSHLMDEYAHDSIAGFLIGGYLRFRRIDAGADDQLLTILAPAYQPGAPQTRYASRGGKPAGSRTAQPYAAGGAAAIRAA
ncbi:hypothetical protein [Salinicola tamaricis]|uniref:hypothetical protein n=1 Tax=Salinicola tamaricis TaxID=1771309 RepID=UPI000D09F45F|nr:hypothetical protein [Salinicola tamaricis]